MSSSLSRKFEKGKGEGSRLVEEEDEVTDPGYYFYSIGDFGYDSPELKQTAEGRLSLLVWFISFISSAELIQCNSM